LREYRRGVSPASASHVVVMLHGYGDRGDGLVPRAELLAAQRPGVAVVALAGRLQRSGPQSLMWWPIRRAAGAGPRDTAVWDAFERETPIGIGDTRRAVIASLERLVGEGADPSRLILAGFSQGAMLAVDVALQRPDLVRAVVAWSGSVVDRGEWLARAPRAGGVHFVVAHGRQDSVLPFRQGQALHSLLLEADSEAEWVPFDGPHTISSEGFEALLSLL
jgi:phospholipase/carboxylesterase